MTTTCIIRLRNENLPVTPETAYDLVDAGIIVTDPEELGTFQLVHDEEDTPLWRYLKARSW